MAENVEPEPKRLRLSLQKPRPKSRFERVDEKEMSVIFKGYGMNGEERHPIFKTGSAWVEHAESIAGSGRGVDPCVDLILDNTYCCSFISSRTCVLQRS